MAEEFKVEVLRHPTEEDWQWVKKLALNTVGKDYFMDKEMWSGVPLPSPGC